MPSASQVSRTSRPGVARGTAARPSAYSPSRAATRTVETKSVLAGAFVQKILWPLMR